MKGKLLILFLILNAFCFGQYVPNTTNFQLTNVTTITTGGSLSAAFTNSTDAYFDATYKGLKDRLTNFRNYTVPLVVTYLSYEGFGSTQVAIRSSVTGSNIAYRGVCWVAGTGTPTTANSKTETATSSGASLPLNCTGLSASTQYTFRPYAKTSNGNTYYGGTVTLTMNAATQSFTSSTSWTAPTGVTSITVECWGAGGTGGPATGTASRGGGGAGGSYAQKTISVTPGNSYTVTVASASTANITNKVDGGSSSFGSSLVVANGGIGGASTSGTAGTGATAVTTGSVGDVIYKGGNGGNGTASGYSGGGGGGAGSSGAGNNATTSTAGTAKSNNGGAGGAGINVANTRNNGSNYGGGGSGGLSNSTTDRAGGNGGQGLVILSFP